MSETKPSIDYEELIGRLTYRVEHPVTGKLVLANRDGPDAIRAILLARQELDEARAEASTCDDIRLDQPLAGIIAELQRDRESLTAALRSLSNPGGGDTRSNEAES